MSEELNVVGDIIYPFYNESSPWYKRNIWEVIEEIDEKGHWKSKSCWYSDETAKLRSMILKLEVKK